MFRQNEFAWVKICVGEIESPIKNSKFSAAFYIFEKNSNFLIKQDMNAISFKQVPSNTASFRPDNTAKMFNVETDDLAGFPESFKMNEKHRSLEQKCFYCISNKFVRKVYFNKK